MSAEKSAACVLAGMICAAAIVVALGKVIEEYQHTEADREEADAHYAGELCPDCQDADCFWSRPNCPCGKPSDDCKDFEAHMDIYRAGGYDHPGFTE